MKIFQQLAKIIVAIYVLYFLAVFFLTVFGLVPLNSIGVFGDAFGAINALFSGAAFVGLVYALVQQRGERKDLQKQLELQQEQMKVQKEELEEVRKDRKATEAQFKLQQQQIEAAELERRQRLDTEEFQQLFGILRTSIFEAENVVHGNANVGSVFWKKAFTSSIRNPNYVGVFVPGMPTSNDTASFQEYKKAFNESIQKFPEVQVVAGILATMCSTIGRNPTNELTNSKLKLLRAIVPDEVWGFIFLERAFDFKSHEELDLFFSGQNDIETRVLDLLGNELRSHVVEQLGINQPQ